MKNLMILAAIAFMMTGCFAPVNSVYDSAELLKTREVQVKGNYSNYYIGGEPINTNYGVSAAYGFSENFNAGLRFEVLTNIVSDFEVEPDPLFKTIQYVEMRGKVNLLRDKIAFESAAGTYFNDAEVVQYSLDNRLYFTKKISNQFEMSVIPKVNLSTGFAGSGMPVQPGIIFGAGFSNNLDKWAIRPEIGYDGYLNVGVGMNYNFQLKK